MSSKPPAKEKAVRSIDGIITPEVPRVQDEPTRGKVWTHASRRVVLAGAGALVAVITTGVVILGTRSSDMFPATVVKQAGFPLYYPSPLPLGYGYQEGSAEVSNGLVTYRIKDGNNLVTISEQVRPPNPPVLTRLAGFTSLSTDAGNAAVGTANTKQPLAIIVSNTTLITITGQANVPSDIVAKVAQAMSSLP